MTEREYTPQPYLDGLSPAEASTLLDTAVVKMRLPAALRQDGLEKIENRLTNEPPVKAAERITTPSVYDFMLASLIQEGLQLRKLGNRR